MKISESKWHELEAAAVGHAMVWQRAAPECPHDLFFGYSKATGRRSFWLEVGEADVESDLALPTLRSMHAELRPGGPATILIVVELVEVSLVDVYRALVNDLMSAVSVASDSAAAVATFVQRLVRWASLMDSASPVGLSPFERRGLVGELIVLRRLLDAGVASQAVLSAWTGPYRANQDFQMPGLAIEVKATSAKMPQRIVVSNERELDDTGVGALLLAHVSLDERKGGEGENLLDAVQEVKTMLAADPTALTIFSDGLLQVGFFEQHALLYKEPHYTLRELQYFQVSEAFPRVIESDLRVGVGNVTYTVELAALAPFLMPEAAAFVEVVS